MLRQNIGSVEDICPRCYSPAPLQNLRRGIKQSLLFAPLAISLHHFYTQTQRFKAPWPCLGVMPLDSEAEEFFLALRDESFAEKRLLSADAKRLVSMTRI
jgi:hypothetical protein